MKDGLLNLIWDKLGSEKEKELIERYAGPENKFHHCSTVHVEQIKGKGIHVKSIEPNALDAEDPPKRRELAEYIAEVMRRYYKWLRRLGVSVPERHEILVIDKADGTIRVVEITSYCGKDLFYILGKEPKKAPELIGKMLNNVKLVFHEKEVGFDPHPANFCENERGVNYIDFFPGRFYFQDTFLVGFPQPDDPQILQYHLRRYYSPFGILRLLRFNLKRIDSRLEPIFFDVLKKTEGIPNEVFDQFKQLPDQNISQLLKKREHGRISEVIESLGPTEVDDLREIAAVIIPHNPLLLTELFNLTHQDLRIPLQKRMVQLALFKDRLHRILRESEEPFGI